MKTGFVKHKIESSVHGDLIVEVHDAVKRFKTGATTFDALRGVSMDVTRGEFLIIYGKSGSGKSTLLNTIIGLEKPTSGTVRVGDLHLEKASEREKAAMRRHHFGVLYQQPLWIKALTVIENTALPLLLSGCSRRKAFKKAAKALESAGVSEFIHRRPTEISGGQQQRVSLARAIVHDPDIIVLDEPTGNLDSVSADQVMFILQNLNQKQNKTILMVTHDLEYLPYANRAILIKDGKIESVTTRTDQLTAKILQSFQTKATK